MSSTHCLKSVKTFDLVLLVNGCILSHLAFETRTESLDLLRAWDKEGEYIGGLRAEIFRPTASQSIHSAELINLRVQIRRYPRSSLLRCAIAESVGFYIGWWQTLSLNRLIGVESPHGLERHIELLFIPLNRYK